MAVAAADPTDLRRRLDAALADYKAGNIGAAAQTYRAIIDQIPDQPDALHMLAVIAQQTGRTGLALQLFDETLRAAPNFALGWSNRALILRVLGRADEALASARQSVAADPGHAGGWDVAGLLLRERRDFEAAAEHHARAAALDPSNAFMQNNYAVALAAAGRLHEAWNAARRAIALNPSLAIAHLTAANILAATGQYERALDYFVKTRALDPALDESIHTEGIVRMLLGEFGEGWMQMERRGYDKTRFAALPLWQGEKTGRLIVYAEQGVGDAIHFLRYVPLIRARAGTLALQVPASLRRLVEAHMPGVTVLTPEDPLPEADAYGLLNSLPHFCGTKLDNIPASIPYLGAREEWRAPWREKLASTARPRLGLVWMGNPRYNNDHNRSLVFDEVRPLIESARAHFVSLQKGSATAAVVNAGIFDAEAQLTDFADSAGLIAELDLVISVDTATAHLAGAMGKPVWLLLPFAPDWRWMLGREDSPWYPSMRLFRQKAPRDWPAVVSRVAAELKKFLDGDGSVLKPPRWQGPPLRKNQNALELPD